ncbi:GNAT family N-acetyltransferase [Noviherbaspirillum sp. CPCC 100848]|uniref:GNAT family N-acetyltransferase n=1 Tax=Noviherbaspirillum album TaxID=3080276 RepID=A0ABU6J4F7_9BURK|nr:GNAT family N-acetyltransferase [Noviherbaspirillum sp. CPCC 100848]MEC4718507.1 GNAT family N-acetyltransferase [Noviherbaspirillum sp. CPCC 100848]
MHDIRLAMTDAEIAATFGVMAQLRTHLKEAEYVALIQHQAKESGYCLACLHDGDRVCAVAGFRISHSLAWGRHVYIDDLISDAGMRSLGYGEALVDWVAAFGKAHGCAELHLDSGVQRHGAHRFYLRNRMDITCYHFKLIL